MHIHFFVSTLGIGGIETYIVRVCQALRLAGWDLSISIIKNKVDQNLLKSVSDIATVQILGLSSKLSILNIDPPPISSDVDIVFATGLTSLLYASKAIHKGSRPTKLVCGVFSQFEYLHRSNDYRYEVCMKILRKLGPSNMVFCTDGCKQDHSRSLEPSWKTSRVSPLLIDIPKMHRADHLAVGVIHCPFRILSVGRLVSFKNYNFYMPRVIRELLNQGYSVRWDVYGDGNEFEAIQAEIAFQKVGDYVTLHGTVPYNTLGERFAEADIYIGSGTTVIEASAAGLPAIVALDNISDSITPGYFCDRKGILTSDFLTGEIFFPVDKIILKHIAMNQENRKKLSDRSINAAQLYSTENAVKEFNAIYNDAIDMNISFPRMFSLYDIINLTFRFLRGNLFSNKQVINRPQ